MSHGQSTDTDILEELDLQFREEVLLAVCLQSHGHYLSVLLLIPIDGMADGFALVLDHDTHDGVHLVLDLVGLDDHIALLHQILTIGHRLTVHRDRIRPLVTIGEPDTPCSLLAEIIQVAPDRLTPLEQGYILVLEVELGLPRLHGIHLGEGTASLYESGCLKHK